MRLKSFQIKNFRSIRDSGVVKVDDLTVLVGPNESGKTNILEALEILKNDTNANLSIENDYPRDQSPETVNESEDIVEVTFSLDAEDRRRIAEVWPSGKTSTSVSLSRKYSTDGKKQTTFWYSFHGSLDISHSDARRTFRTKGSSLQSALKQSPRRRALGQFVGEQIASLPSSGSLEDWKKQALQTLSEIDEFVSEHSIALTDTNKLALGQLKTIASNATDELSQRGKAARMIFRSAPTFTYYDSYPDIPGSQSIGKFLLKTASERDASDEAFADFLLVAGIDLNSLNELATTNSAKRKRIIDEAGNRITKRLREFWRQSKLRVRIDVDGDSFDIFVRDEDEEFAGEINLSFRSRGFQWFFGFLITSLAATLRHEDSSPPILLLDEAGLHLHPSAQEYLISLLNSLKNQVIYSTHLPFMLPYASITDVKGVTYKKGVGTTIISDITEHGPAAQMLQSLLGYQTTETYLLSSKDLLTEGVTDYWLLTAVSALMNATTGDGLDPRVAVTPCHGMNKTPAFVSLFRSNGISVALLLDSSAESTEFAKKQLVETKLIPDKSVFFVGQFIGNASSADIEDLFDPDVYVETAREIHDEIKWDRLMLNSEIPRIVIRLEKAFSAIGATFQKRRVAKRLSEKIARRDIALTDSTLRAFRTLFREVEQALENQPGSMVFK